MTKNNAAEDQLSAFDAFGEAFGLQEDPLKTFDLQFKQSDADPIEIYCESVIMQKQRVQTTNEREVLKINNWVDHMDQYDRHAACPSISHVVEYITKEIRKGNQPDTIIRKLTPIKRMFEYWSEHPQMPHGFGEAQGFNPVVSAQELMKDDIKGNAKSEEKLPHPISIEGLGHEIRQIKNILHRTFIVCQLKHGSRGGQTCNIQHQDVNLNHEELNDLYPDLGTHPRLSDIEEDAIYYPSIDEREGGKSKRPIVLPIDNELKRLLVRYLRQRPPVEKPWLFLHPVNCGKISTQYASRRFWKGAFHPKYSETDMYRPVTSHYARHRFNTYWKKEVDINSEHLKYMRGDKQGDINSDSKDVIYTYIHTYYTDIRDKYLKNIFMFNI
ncbi:site-specific integrase [Streptomyces sanglieri]